MADDSRGADHCIENYDRWRTYRTLGMNSSGSRPVQRPPPGNVNHFPEVGVLHYYYERMAARLDVF